MLCLSVDFVYEADEQVCYVLEVDTEVREYLESILGHVSPGGTRYRLPSCLTGRELGRRMSMDHKQRVSTIKGLAQRHKSIMISGDDEGFKL